MSSLLQDLGIVETVLGDISSFAAGNAISTTVDGYGVAVKVLPNGPIAPFTPIVGSFFSIIFAVLGLAGEFQSGIPITIAIKENVTYYGVTLTPPKTTPPPVLGA